MLLSKYLFIWWKYIMRNIITEPAIYFENIFLGWNIGVFIIYHLSAVISLVIKYERNITFQSEASGFTLAYRVLQPVLRGEILLAFIAQLSMALFGGSLWPYALLHK